MDSDFFTVSEGGVRLTVKAKPGSSRTRAPKLVPLAGGGRAVEIAVAEAPEDGKANKAILAVLADALGVKRGDVVLKMGASGKLKIFEIQGDPSALKTRVYGWLGELWGF